MTQLRAHPDVQGMGELANNKTPEEVALLVIGAHMTHSQFDHLCKQGGFRDPKYRSRYFLTEGFKAVEKSLPRIKIMKRPFLAPSLGVASPPLIISLTSWRTTLAVSSLGRGLFMISSW